MAAGDTDMGGAEPSVTPTGQDPDNGDEGVTVCITALSDGTFQVQIQETGDGDEEGESEAGDGPQSADNLQDALKLAGEMLTAEMGEEGNGDSPMDPGAAKAAWNAMAAKRDQQRAMG